MASQSRFTTTCTTPKTQYPASRKQTDPTSFPFDQGIPSKGALLTQLSTHWFAHLRSALPTLRTHLLPASTPSTIPPPHQLSLAKRSMTVRRLPLIPLESIVRGYITGSAWSEYKKSGTVHGLSMSQGLRESEKLARPLWTPSTKAEQGEHDENISPERAGEIVGTEVAKRVEELSLQIYQIVS